MRVSRGKKLGWFVIVGFGLVGIATMAFTHAATPVLSFEPEAKTITNPASVITDQTASNGKAVKFAAAPSGSLTAADLTAVKSKRILFGHQSVGANMIDGIPTLYSSYGVSSPRIIGDLSQIPSSTGGFFAEFYVGSNYDPVGKMADFNATVRQYSTKLDIALMKLCFVDIDSGTNAQQLFNSYKATMDGLVRDFPNIKFVYTTAALDDYDTGAAIVREQYNSLIRQAYGSTGRVFDLAKVESTRPDGTRVSGVSGGQTYYQPYGGYTSDGGHLNNAGVKAVDTALFKLLSSL